MELTEKEKEIFRLHDEELVENASYHVEDGLLEAYYTTNENSESMNVTYSYVKRMIVEYCKKKNYNINPDIRPSTDEILTRIVELDEYVPGFNPLYYKNPQQMNNYFDNLTKDMNSEELDRVIFGFSRVINDSFRNYFIQFIPKLIDLSGKIEEELRDKELGYSEWVDSEFEDTGWIDKEWDDSEWIDEEWQDSTESEKVWGEPTIKAEEWTEEPTKEDKELSEESLRIYLEFINVVKELVKYKILGNKISNKLFDLKNKRKIDEFLSDESFLKDFTKILEHDKRKKAYYFHGTQCLADADTILEEGLGMMQDNLTSTSYKEFSMEDIILYSRGLGGEIGRDAIVIIDVPKDKNGKEIDVVRKTTPDDNLHFCPSGLQGLSGKAEYIVPTEYIVGYIDKLNKKVVFNPNYKEFDRFEISEENKL